MVTSDGELDAELGVERSEIGFKCRLFFVFNSFLISFVTRRPHIVVDTGTIIIRVIESPVRFDHGTALT